MTTYFKQEQLQPSPAYQSGCTDTFDPDAFINFDQLGSISPHSSLHTPISSSSDSNAFTSNQSNPQFTGPSHQYGEYKQHAGFPVGALAGTYAVNQADNYGYGNGQHDYSMTQQSSNGYFNGTFTEGDIDFNSLPDQTVPSRDIDSSFGHSTDMTTLNSSYVDPTAIGGQEDTSRTQSIQPHPVRAYPGMHTENAQRQAIAQQQQQRQSHSRQPSRNGGANKAVDPLLDQSISRLLNQMRHSSVASSHDENDDDPTTLNANGQTYGNRKDEEDMDEDEKLLASEEGKKLSSKERRQLRNKVSARAFRSRRKEYIGQLEGEINVKNTECEDLRRKNEQLKAENTRLTDLTQMLLSSPHFQPFLEELGRSEAAASGNMPSQVPRLQLHTPAPVSQTSSRSKDVNPNHVIPHQSQDNMHIGLTMVPEEPAIDFTVIDPLNTHYGHSDFSPLYMNSQVYAVTAVPQGPAVDRPDFGLLSGKLSNFVGPYSPLEDNGKDEPLSVHSLPAKTNTIETIETPAENLTIDVSDAALALYSGSEGSLSVAAPRTVAPEDSMFGEIELDKAFSRIELSIDSTANITIESEISSAVLERFERLCSRCDLLSSRIATHTAHLL